MKDGSYLIKNLWTNKTFQPCEAPSENTKLYQNLLEANDSQYWELLPVQNEEGCNLIRLKGTEFYITPESSDSNASLLLKPLLNIIIIIIIIVNRNY